MQLQPEKKQRTKRNNQKLKELAREKEKEKEKENNTPLVNEAEEEY